MATAPRVLGCISLTLSIGGCIGQQPHTWTPPGLHWSVPQGLAVSFNYTPYAGENGMCIQLLPGIRASKAFVGHFWYVRGDLGGDMRALKLGLMHTYNDPLGAPSGQTYIGVEWQHAFFAPWLMYTVGAYGHVAGDSQDRSPVYSIGTGLIF